MTHVFKQLNQIVRFKQKIVKIELESLFLMNYLIQKWLQVQNDLENAMTIDISELTINVLLLMKSRSLHNSTKKGFLIFLTVTWQPFMKYHLSPSFSSRNITKNAETNPPPMRDVIIEQPLYQTIDWNWLV